MGRRGTGFEITGRNLQELGKYKVQQYSDILAALDDVIETRKHADGGESYVAYLYGKGLGAMTDKITEEAEETVEAACSGDVNQVIYETADLWFHSLVLLSYFDCNHGDVLKELRRRFGVSGIAEQRSR